MAIRDRKFGPRRESRRSRSTDNPRAVRLLRTKFKGVGDHIPVPPQLVIIESVVNGDPGAREFRPAPSVNDRRFLRGSKPRCFRAKGERHLILRCTQPGAKYGGVSYQASTFSDHQIAPPSLSLREQAWQVRDLRGCRPSLSR